MKNASDFIESPLAVWAKSLLQLSHLDYEKFPNGEYFYSILKLTDQRLANSSDRNAPNDGDPFDSTRTRLLCLDFILRKVRSFYLEVLNQIILIKPPDIYQIAKYPESEKTFKEMETMLLLLLGVAINGEFKEKFIFEIQQNLDTECQMELVPFIQLVTEDCWLAIPRSIRVELSSADKSTRSPIIAPIQTTTTTTTTTTSSTLIVNIELNEQSGESISSSSLTTTSFTQPSQLPQTHQTSPDQLILTYPGVEQLNYFLSSKLLPHIQRIVEERDSFLESIIELEQDKDYLKFQLGAQTQNVEVNAANPESNDVDFKSMSMNELIANLVNNSSAICKIEYLTSKSSSGELGESNMALMALMDSIYKELMASEKMAAGLAVANPAASLGSKENETGQSGGLNELKNKKICANGWNQKIAIELVECKLKLRQLVNEIEEKCEQIESLKDEIDEVKKQVNKLRGENVDLQQRAALANVYSEELESIREKSIKVDKYESEMIKLKERIDELQMNQARFDELKEENLILSETRAFMEKQMSEYQTRVVGLQRMDAEVGKYRQEIDDLNKQSELDKKRLCELCEKNAKLEIEMKNVLNQNVSLDEEVNYYKQKYTFLSAELAKQQQALVNIQQSAHTQNTQLIEVSKLKRVEAEHRVTELAQQLKQRDQELSKLKEQSRSDEISLDECLAKIRVLTDKLNLEQENKLKCERVLDQHKLEIKELQLKLDDCVRETRKLDESIRAAAHSNEMKSNENEENFKKLIDSHEQLNQSYKKLLGDHEDLQNLYIHLESDYDELYADLSRKHLQVNNLSGELDELRDKYAASLAAAEEKEKKLVFYTARKFIEVEVNTELEGDFMQLKLDQIEKSNEEKISTLNFEINDLKEKREILEIKIKEMNETMLKTNDVNLTLKNENKGYQIETTRQQEKIQVQFLQISQLNDKIQTLEFLHEKLEDEKSQLFEQLHLLLQQNQEILTQTLNNKDIYHEETKAYMQQLNNLKRQKEILEQKIMEQYKSCPSLSQKQKGKKSLNFGNNGTNHGLMDMFSKTTRHFVQKVRNKSSSSSSTSSSCTHQTPHELHSVAHFSSDPATDDSDHNHSSNNLHENCAANPKLQLYCHKYSADDIHYLNIQTKEIEVNSGVKLGVNNTNNSNNVRGTVSSLSSSSSTSSNSSSSSIPQINYEPVETTNPHQQQQRTNFNKQLLITPVKQGQFILSTSTTPVKCDPKSLKLGGRPQSICSSPTPNVHASPNPLTTKSHDNNKRSIITSSPRYSLSINNNSLSPSPSTVSSLISKTPNYSSISIQKQSPSAILLSSLSANKNKLPNQKKENLKSVQLIPQQQQQQQIKKLNSKFSLKLADSLSKFHESLGNEDEDDEDDSEDDHENDEDEMGASLMRKTREQKQVALNTTANNAQKSNEFWLEYGCI